MVAEAEVDETPSDEDEVAEVVKDTVTVPSRPSAVDSIWDA